MKINNLLIIPDKKNIEKCTRMANEYGLGFEYNDFFLPQILDDQDKVAEIIEFYQSRDDLPKYCTTHGAFLDVTVFSDDPLIKQVSDKRVEQSIAIARRIGARSVVFHTNYVTNFNTKSYQDNWVKKNADYWSEKLDKYKDIEIYIENMFDVRPELLARLAEALEGEKRFGVCLDYAHIHVFGQESELEEWIKILASYVKHIHINDNDFSEDLHMAVGQGKIDWNNFKYYYEKYMSQASVLLEVMGFDKIEKSIRYVCDL